MQVAGRSSPVPTASMAALPPMRLIFLLLHINTAVGVAGNAKAGGAGYAMAFDGFQGTTISLRWDGTQTEALSFEYWLNLLDPHSTQQPVVAYSAYSVSGRYGQGGDSYENANELVGLHSTTSFRLFRATSLFDVDDTTAHSTAGQWNHFAVVWSADPKGSRHGQFAFYINGARVFNTTVCAYQACDFGMAVQPKGVVHIGQEADRPWGDFDQMQALTGVVDELRMWTTVLSDEQIAARYQTGLAGAGTATENPGLWLSWSFDEPGLTRGSLAADSSGAGRDAHVGAMTTTENQLQYSTGRASEEPQPPLQLPSTARYVANGDVVVPVVMGRANAVTLLAYDPDGDALVLHILSVPQRGLLTTATGTELRLGDTLELAASEGSGAGSGSVYAQRVEYTPTLPSASEPAWSGDSFTYHVSDGGTPSASATVQLVPHAVPIARSRRLTFVEDELSFGTLAAVGISSVRKETGYYRVRITSLPERGTLYQACFKLDSDSTYSALCDADGVAHGENGMLTAIRAVGTVLANTRGIFMFLPAPNEFGEAYARFSYRLVDPDDEMLTSAEANVTITVSSSNDAPVGQPVALQIGNSSEALTILLQAKDSDEDNANQWTYAPGFATSRFSRIFTFARGGQLFQTNHDGSLGDMLDATISKVPEVSSWAKEVCEASHARIPYAHTYGRALVSRHLVKIYMRTHGRALVSRLREDAEKVYIDGAPREDAPTCVTWTRIRARAAWQVVRYSSQFSKCDGCFVWSGGEDHGCDQADPRATSTCTRGEACSVPLGSPLRWGDGSCSDTAWHATAVLGAPDFYPGYGDTTKVGSHALPCLLSMHLLDLRLRSCLYQGWDLSSENGGKEWIELRFDYPVYVSGLELYETCEIWNSVQHGTLHAAGSSRPISSPVSGLLRSCTFSSIRTVVQD